MQLAVGLCFQAAALKFQPGALKATVACRVCNRLYTVRLQLSCSINPYIKNDPEVPEFHTIEPFTGTRLSYKITPTLNDVSQGSGRKAPSCSRAQ